MRFNYPLIALFAALMFLSRGLAYGGDIFIVTRAAVKLATDDIREIYFGDKEYSGNVRLVPVDNRAAQA